MQDRQPDAPGFHEGELAVQRRAGVAEEASRLLGMLGPARLGPVSRLLAADPFVAITARDREGRLWTSALTGPVGSVRPVAETTLSVRSTLRPGDPLDRLPVGQPVGLLLVDFPSRRRVRVNGTLVAREGDDGQDLRIDVVHAFGNCPQHIRRRRPAASAPAGPSARRRGAPTDSDLDLVRAADTFVIGTTHPARGNDTSHRGGDPGFVRVEDGSLWWPDHAGNNMFATLGNLVVDPTAALLFVDFATGRTLQLSGRAALEWTARGAPGDDGATGRRVRFTPDATVVGG